MGGFRLFVGDCLDLVATLDAASIDAIVTDPPYGTGTKDAIYGRRREGKRTSIANDADLSQLALAAPGLLRVLKPEGVAVVFCAPSMRRAAEGVLEDAGFALHGVVSWDKGSPGISYRVRYSHEDAMIAAGRDADPWETREPLVSPIRVPRVPNPMHPNEKPVALLRALIRWALPTRGTVLDPFAGSASCGVAALAERCDYIGAEIDPQWVAVAERRLAEASDLPHPDIEQPTLFGSEAA